ncbi:hypothetical protein PALU110988_11930 [Paenibacillus lupini]|uniref:hypothetical protein n=1 Tax=Paenibacillus lupini TaxID=1450204 RepID=UPI00141F0EFB|nr:hypothetical protein [Paenibacillus lupini]NIK21365.1 hypothetical protein [Paenibacillus lupini]
MLLLTLTVLSGCSYSTLDEAIQKKWDDRIEVLYVDEEHQSVIFLDPSKDNPNHSVYVYSTYKKSGNAYRYSTDPEHGTSFSVSSDLIPFLFKWNGGDKKTDNVIWGAIRSDITVKEIAVTCTPRNDESKEIKFKIPVHNQVFIYYPELDFQNSPYSWRVKAEALDENGKVIADSGY